jgi:hypothetical protein
MARSNRQISLLAVLLVVATVGATPAAAQPTAPAPSPSPARFELSANVGVVTGASTFTETHSRAGNGGETETITADHGVKTGPAFSGGGAVRLVPKLWVGVQYATVEMKSSAAITAVVPHPILFNAPRTVEGTMDNVVHNEQNVHVDVMYVLPVHALDVKIMGGPTFFNVKQDFVSSVTLNETYPFDTATFGSATTKRLSKGAVGFNAGVDLSYPLSRNLGIGGLVRYSRADVKFDDPEIGQQTVKAGGVELAGGIRVRF